MKSGVIGLVLQLDVNGKYFKGDGMGSLSKGTCHWKEISVEVSVHVGQTSLNFVATNY